jgi:hypothetical protein
MENMFANVTIGEFESNRVIDEIRLGETAKPLPLIIV